MSMETVYKCDFCGDKFGLESLGAIADIKHHGSPNYVESKHLCYPCGELLNNMFLFMRGKILPVARALGVKYAQEKP